MGNKKHSKQFRDVGGGVIVVPQDVLPLQGITRALEMTQRINRAYPGRAVPAPLATNVCGYSALSSGWRYTLNAIVAYGLLSKNIKAGSISVTGLGRKAVAGKTEQERKEAVLEAVLFPSLQAEIYRTLEGKDFPPRDALRATLREKGLPEKRMDVYLDILHENALRSGIIRKIEGKETVRLKAPVDKATSASVKEVSTAEPVPEKTVLRPERAATVAIPPKEILYRWVEAYNAADVDALTALYDDDAVRHLAANRSVAGKAAIRTAFQHMFAAARLACIVENIFTDGQWAILGWKSPSGLRGCGFFQIVNSRIVFQRDY